MAHWGACANWSESQRDSITQPRVASPASYAGLKRGGSYAILPVKRAAVQVHHRFEVNGVGAHTVDDGVGKAVEVELAIRSPDFAPPFRHRSRCGAACVQTRPGRRPQARLPLLIPERGGFQFGVGFRMTDDAH